MNTESNNNVYFKKLNSDEKKSKINQLAKNLENKIVVWKKGTTNKVSMTPVDFDYPTSVIQVTGSIPEEYANQDLLVSFEISGLHFFGICSLESPTGEKFFLKFLGDLYKSERRSNFRLLTYPHQNVFLHLKVDPEDEEKSNIVNFQTGVSETGLFQNFLKIIEEDNPDANVQGYIKLRVLDISVTGLALQLGPMEAKLFTEKDKELGLMYLEFNGKMVKIPNGEILYTMDFVGSDKKTAMLKAGLRFKDVNTNLDEELASLINQTLRSLESEFEDFIK